MHAYGHDAADRWLLKDDTEAIEVMESGNEFHSVIVLEWTVCRLHMLVCSLRISV